MPVKKSFFLISILAAIPFFSYPLQAQSPEASKSKHVAVQVLKLLRMEYRKDHLPGQISGGEMQRVAIARAMVNKSEIILDDEPTGNLDTKRTPEIIEVLKDLNKTKRLTIIMITHNLELAGYADRKFEMRDGRICELG